MKEFCLFNSNKKCDNCGECDSCVYDNKKICNNCGKCMEEEGIDIKAIKIEEIAKAITENKILEEELSESEMNEIDDDNINDDNMEDFESLEEGGFNTESPEKYEDAWDHIEYVEDIDSLVMEEDFSDEIFPGLRRVKRSI
ncbi:MAG: hypothetical protein ABRQ25_02820 [Clostridiaceae bacterium]